MSLTSQQSSSVCPAVLTQQPATMACVWVTTTLYKVSRTRSLLLNDTSTPENGYNRLSLDNRWSFCVLCFVHEQSVTTHCRNLQQTFQVRLFFHFG